MTKLEKSSQREKLMGSQTPSVRIAPDYVYTDGADAVKVLSVGRLIVDPWQGEVLNDWMGRTEEEIWSAPTCGLSVPRQNGKTLDTSGRIASGMIMYSEWVIYTAHLQKTATETFMELKVYLLERHRQLRQQWYIRRPGQMQMEAANCI